MQRNRLGPNSQHQRASKCDDRATLHAVKKSSSKNSIVSAAFLHLAAVLLVSAPLTAEANSFDQAKRIHERLTGVAPSPEVLSSMKQAIDDGNGIAAAEQAMENDAFYTVTLKNWAAPWTNRDQDVFVPLNDYIATVIGYVRDERDFRGLLYDDVIYHAPNAGAPSYAANNNAHYSYLEEQNVSLKDELVATAQSQLTSLPPEAAAGVVTTRAAARSFFIAGTNRANFRYTLLNHLCLDLEQLQDNTRTPDRIRQDVSRSPGGDSRVFVNNCSGCHSGMDPLAQAFAYYDYQYDAENDLLGEEGRISYNTEGTIDPDTNSRVVKKYHINSTTFPQGFVTPNDQWNNYWRQGVNRFVGWDETLPGSGNGAKSMLQELSHSQAFASCQVKKVFNAVCLREPDSAADASQLSAMESSFASGGYNIKDVFAQSADYCKGE